MTIQVRYRPSPGLGTPLYEGPAFEQDDRIHSAIEVIDDLSFSERAVFSATADALAGPFSGSQEPQAITHPDGSITEETYAMRRLRMAKRIGFGLRVLGAVVAPVAATRGGRHWSKTSWMELGGWSVVGFFRPILGNAAALIRGGSR